MGLDVTAYRKLTKIDAVWDATGHAIDPATREEIHYDLHADASPDYPERIAGIEDNTLYISEDSMALPCGAYSRYNRWREDLAKMAGWPEGSYHQYGQDYPSHAASAWQATSGPFWELINFSDCEGTIGPEVSRKLLADFIEHDQVAATMDEQFYAQYSKWKAAFEMAADGGAVDFH